jgi:hypothetical protein
MGRIIWREFLGSRIIFFLLCLSIIGIPFAVLYLLEHLVTVEEAVEKPGQYVEEWKAGKHRPAEGGKA